MTLGPDFGDHDGKVLMQYKLSDGVKALVADERWIYAGCDDGKVYDLSCKVPTVAYEVSRNTEVLWLEIFGGKLCVSDGRSRCTVYDHEGEKRGHHDGHESPLHLGLHI